MFGNISVRRSPRRIETNRDESRRTLSYVGHRDKSKLIEMNRDESRWIETARELYRAGERQKRHCTTRHNEGQETTQVQCKTHVRDALRTNIQDCCMCSTKRLADRMFPYVAQHTIFFETRSSKTESHEGRNTFNKSNNTNGLNKTPKRLHRAPKNAQSQGILDKALKYSTR